MTPLLVAAALLVVGVLVGRWEKRRGTEEHHFDVPRPWWYKKSAYAAAPFGFLFAKSLDHGPVLIALAALPLIAFAAVLAVWSRRHRKPQPVVASGSEGGRASTP